MNPGRKCKYAGECPAYNNQIDILDKPVYLIRNVFCNRGKRGWVNCTRYNMLESEEPVSELTNPYSDPL